MALPKLVVPKYKLKLPSDGRTVNYRPFLVKEEKLLLLATETGEQADLMAAIKTIITACSDLEDIDGLATFDIEFLFLQIRTKSVGEAVELSVTCPDDGETTVKVKIPLDDIKVQKTRGHKKELKLSDEVIVNMCYPSLESFVEMNFQDGQQVGMEQIFKMAAGCVSSIATEDEVHDCKELPQEEIIEFFEGLSSKQFKLIQDFFDTMPKLKHTVKVVNPNTKKENEIILEGLAAFFE